MGMVSVATAGRSRETVKRHQGRGDEPVHEGGKEKDQELLERHHAFLPHHERRDVAERAEGTAGVGRDHDVDTGRGDEAAMSGPGGHGHCAHDQCRGQVVGDGREEEGKKTGPPENGAQGESSGREPGAQRLKDPAFLQGVDIGHRRQEEQEEPGKFQKVLADRGGRDLGLAVIGVGERDQCPDGPRRDHDGLGLAQAQGFLGDDQGIGHGEYPERRTAGPVAGEIQRRTLPAEREPRAQESGHPPAESRSPLDRDSRSIASHYAYSPADGRRARVCTAGAGPEVGSAGDLIPPVHRSGPCATAVAGGRPSVSRAARPAPAFRASRGRRTHSNSRPCDVPPGARRRQIAPPAPIP
jgi:hypothetical protein